MIKAYASYFVSYLLSELDELSNINYVVLFGSASRGDVNKDSDIDIFLEEKKKDIKFEKAVNKIIEKFYISREYLMFKNKGMDNKINVLFGKIEEFSKVKEGIDNYGIVLYGRYVSSSVKGNRKVIISWDKVGKNRGAFLNKLYGFKANEKSYPGIIKLLNGKKIGKSSFMLPFENKEEVFSLIKKYKVDARVLEVYSE